MRTISESLKSRLIAQAEEAKTLGLQKVAQQLNDSVRVAKVRKNDEAYSYDFDELKQNVEAQLWEAAIRTQDFYNKTADARFVHDLIEDFAEDFIDQMRLKIGGTVGAFEEPVAGQGGEFTDIEVSDDK